MRMIMQVRMPNEKFNAAVSDGSAGQKMKRILDEIKPESVYFTEYKGQRGAIMIIDLKEPSQIPALAEPWFIGFDAEVEFHVAITPDELGRAGLDALGKKWS
jgi:hypothetical protein